ncbi:hypothetical protein [Pseudoalteromonas sp. MMG012]|uniref:hypothetical protein n=1 Tax=Pseudoalteromonas sp. MMG012 TaxID=2822686 RepID=UPI001B3A67D4|nr:hypothetical protein [Pseudoalteromonas sp. MMG012]MBQ4852667.1 hypothetical protein [Pseudoalteromonas sp. MMG012]
MKLLLIPALLLMTQATADELLVAEPVELSQHTFSANGQTFAKVAQDAPSTALYKGDQVAELHSHETYTLTGEIIVHLPTYVVAQHVAESLGYTLSYTRGQRAIFTIDDTDTNLSIALTKTLNLDSVISAQLGMKPDAIEAE